MPAKRASRQRWGQLMRPTHELAAACRPGNGRRELGPLPAGRGRGRERPQACGARRRKRAHKFALENFSKELLAVKDSLEMGLEPRPRTPRRALREGSEATLKLLTGDAWQRFGIEEVDPARRAIRSRVCTKPSACSRRTTSEPGSVAERDPEGLCPERAPAAARIGHRGLGTARRRSESPVMA